MCGNGLNLELDLQWYLEQLLNMDFGFYFDW